MVNIDAKVIQKIKHNMKLLLNIVRYENWSSIQTNNLNLQKPQLCDYKILSKFCCVLRVAF